MNTFKKWIENISKDQMSLLELAKLGKKIEGLETRIDWNKTQIEYLQDALTKSHEAFAALAEYLGVEGHSEENNDRNHWELLRRKIVFTKKSK